MFTSLQSLEPMHVEARLLVGYPQLIQTGRPRLLRGDANEVLRALRLLTEPSQVIELRLLHVLPERRQMPVTMSGYFNDPGELANKALAFGGCAQGTYITLNPINPALLARAVNRIRIIGRDDPLTTDADTTRRCWLPIDFDPVRPRGISSTDDEHDRAIARAFRVRDVLRGEGWADPIVGDSGNGSHLLYRVELPTIDGGLVKRCLEALAVRFDDDAVRIDTSVFNPSRIWKLYGSASRKGDHVTARPHCLARILEAP